MTPGSSAGSITPREHGILSLLQGGRSRSQAAAALGISRGNLNWFAAQAYEKLGITSLDELLRLELPAPRDRRTERIRRTTPGARRGDVAICAGCGRPFRQWTSRTLFCSRHCDMRVRARRRRLSTRSCLVCGVIFQPYNAKMRHCSRHCSQVTARATLRDRARRYHADYEAQTTIWLGVPRETSLTHFELPGSAT
ncbi:MAG: LuxR C-terminal-related transcriptional regulator [Chloroflexota bacterium]|nr:LuxR C-terminal-related transcriptional regulator [Chloroflexota bacterium]